MGIFERLRACSSLKSSLDPSPKNRFEVESPHPRHRRPLIKGQAGLVTFVWPVVAKREIQELLKTNGRLVIIVPDGPYRWFRDLL